MKIVVLGGAGLMGRSAVADLANQPGHLEIVVADRDLAAAESLAESLGLSNVRPQRVDARNHEELVGLLSDADAVLNAVNYVFNIPIMRAALEARVPYVDLGGLFHTTRRQWQLHDEFAAAGICAVLSMGSAPGITNVQARYGADRLDKVHAVKCYDGMSVAPNDEIGWGYALDTILDEMSLSPWAFERGALVEVESLSGEEEFTFVPPIGHVRVHHTIHSEAATIPVSLANKGIQECFFKINAFGYSESVFNRLKTLISVGLAESEPIDVEGTAVRPRAVLAALLERQVRQADQTVAHESVEEIATVVEGERQGDAVSYRIGTVAYAADGLDSGARVTGIPPAIVARWLADRTLDTPGVYPPEQIINPEAFFAELNHRGIATSVTVTEPLLAQPALV